MAFPEPGAYTIKVQFPLIGAILKGSEVSIPDRSIESNAIQVQVVAPQGDDIEVFEAIRGDGLIQRFLWTSEPGPGVRSEPAQKVAWLLRDHPKTGYRDALHRALLDYYRKYLKSNRPASDPDREEIRRVLGEPDDRLFADDTRLDQEVLLDYPKPTHLSRVFASLRQQADVPLDASPYFLLPRSQMTSFRKTVPLREAMLLIAGPPDAAWVRRGNGYYLYCETFGGPKEREITIELLGPVEVLFPEDQRLDVQVVAEFSEPTSIDRVLAAYAQQSQVPLDASPFFRRCIQSGPKMTLNLRPEMAWLARTFRAKWERRGDGYVLAAEKGADEDALPPGARRIEPAEPAKGATRIMVLAFGGLTALAIAGFALRRAKRKVAVPLIR